MKNTVYFAICRYVPSLLRGESINIGFVYHVPTLKKLGFFNSKNTRRIMSFDDEIDAETISMLFESLDYDFNDSPDLYYNDDLDKDLSDTNLLSSKLYNYVNQIQFSDINVMEYEETTILNDFLQSTLNDIADMYLYYDKPKGNRITHDRVKSLTKKIIKSNLYTSSLELIKTEEKFYNTPFDFKLNFSNNEYFLKGFSLDYSQEGRLIKEVKSYLFDLEHSIENGRVDPEQIIIVTNNVNFSSKELDFIKNVFPNEIEIYTLEKFDSFINQLKEQTKEFCLS